MTNATSVQARIDESNARFWDELCGTGLARQLGIVDRSQESLRRFDDAYMALYPYLLHHVPVADMGGRRVLEVGLGYGTLSQKIAEARAEYIGLDIAAGPVDMVNARMRLKDLKGEARQGNILDSGLPSGYFDTVVSIGCFHHTGDVQRCIDETYRMLRPGGDACIMLYNKYSLRRWMNWPATTAASAIRELLRIVEPRRGGEAERAAYDTGAAGNAAPETVFLSRRDIHRAFSGYSRVTVQSENSDPLTLIGKVLVPRERMLATVGRILGLDLYIRAVK
jgi:SAM-dependent methyltransferase